MRRAVPSARVGPPIGAATASRRRRRRQRQANDELAALADAGAVRADPAAVHLDQRLRQRQADAQAALRAVERRLRPGRTSRRCGQLRGGDADAGVAHAHHRVAALALDRERDPAAARRVLGGVDEQVREHLRQPRQVAVDRDRLGRQAGLERVAGGLDRRLGDLDRLLEHAPAAAAAPCAAASWPRAIRDTSSRSSSRCDICATWRSITSRHHATWASAGSLLRSTWTAFLIGASGLRSSCASVAMKSSFLRSASRSASSACRRSVMSMATPKVRIALPALSYSVWPRCAIQRTGPSPRTMRISCTSGTRLAIAVRRRCRNPGRSSGWIRSATLSASARSARDRRRTRRRSGATTRGRRRRGRGRRRPSARPASASSSRSRSSLRMLSACSAR